MASFELKLASAQGRLQRRHATMFASGHPFLIILSPGCTSLRHTQSCHRRLQHCWQTTHRYHFWALAKPQADRAHSRPGPQLQHPGDIALQQPQAVFSSVAGDFLSLQGAALWKLKLLKACDRGCRCSDDPWDHIACNLCCPTQARAADRLGAVPRSEVHRGR